MTWHAKHKIGLKLFLASGTTSSMSLAVASLSEENRSEHEKSSSAVAIRSAGDVHSVAYISGSTIQTSSLYQSSSRIIALRGCRGCSSPGVVASYRILASTLFFASTRLTWLQMHDVFCGEMLTVSIAAGRLRGDVDGFYCRGAVVFEGFVKAGMGS